MARVHASGVTRAEVRPLARPTPIVVSHTSSVDRSAKLRRSANRTKRAAQVAGQSIPRPRALAPSPNHVIFASGPSPCTGCPQSGSSGNDAGGFLLTLAKSLDMVSLFSNLEMV